MATRGKKQSSDRKLTAKQYFWAVFEVAKLSFKTAPLAVGFKLLGALINAILPLLITYFAALTTTALADAYNGDPNAGSNAIRYVVIAAALGLFGTAWRSVDQYVQQVMRYRVESKMSDVMYEHFHDLEFWRYDDKEMADLYDRAQRFSSFYAYVFDRLADIVTSVIAMVLALIALLLFVPFIALVVFIAVIPGVFIQFKLSREQIEHWNKNVAVRRSKGYIEWNLLQPNAIAELRLNGLVRHLLNLRKDLRDKDEYERLKFERSYIGKRLFADTLETTAELGSLIWVTLQIIAGNLAVGQFVFVQQIVSRALRGANDFVNLLSSLDEDLANLSDYQKFMELPSAAQGVIKLSGPPHKIVFDSVSFEYPGANKKVLKDISFSVDKGENIAIVGENGAGKSTLIKLLSGLYSPTDGRILLGNVPLSEINLPTWHNQISVLQQDFQQYSFTNIKNNVVFGKVEKSYRSENYQSALQQAEAQNFIDKLPQKDHTIPSTWMEDDEGNNGVMISGGQWQRLALARGFYRDAPIIILDEPTSAIDAIAESRIFKRLFETQNDKTVFTISHRLTTVQKADYILVMKNGRIVERGTHQELVPMKGEYYRMFESQLI